MSDPPDPPTCLWLEAQAARLSSRAAELRLAPDGAAAQLRARCLDEIARDMRVRIASAVPARAAGEQAQRRASARPTPYRGGWATADMEPPLAEWRILEAERFEALAAQWRAIGCDQEADEHLALAARHRHPPPCPEERPPPAQPPTFRMPPPFVAGPQLALL